MTAKVFRAWTLAAIGRPPRFALEERPVPVPHPQGVLVGIESAVVLSYMHKVLDGSIGYATPPLPFVPGTNAIGRVVAIGAEVSHLAVGDRVFLSPHFIADEPTPGPPQILIGLTATGTARFGGVAEGSRKLQQVWRDGVFAEMAHWPASCTTPLRGLDHIPAERLIALAKLVVPYGGLLRSEVKPGQTIIVNGATGYFGSAGVMLAAAMGASRVLALGRSEASLACLASALGPRVVPVVATGDHDTDVAAIQTAAGGKADIALDLVGQAASTTTTLAALRSLKRRGRLVLMGSASVPLPVSFGDMLSNDWEVVGNFMYPKTAPGQLAAMIAAGLLDLSPIRVRSFALSQLPDAIQAATTMRDLDLTAVLPD